MARVHGWLSWSLLSLLAVGGVLWVTLAMAASDPQAQALFQGPAQGTSALGATADTALESSVAPLRTTKGGAAEIPTGRIPLVQLPDGMQPLTSPLSGSNEVDDLSAPGAVQPEVISGNLTASFEGPPDIVDSFGFLSIPPDSVTAAGPNHLIGAVNTPFEIFGKSGVMQSRVDATVWF